MGWRPALAAALALISVLAAPPAAGRAPTDDDGARRQLALDRRAADVRFEQEQAECRQRFALNACLDNARATHRRTQAGLKEQERVLEARRRQQRALDRQSAIASRQQAVQSRLPEPDAAPPRQAAASGAPPKAERDDRVRRARDAAAAKVKAEERSEAARKLQAVIAADQARIQERQARRQAQGRPAQPLPLPGSSAASAMP